MGYCFLSNHLAKRADCFPLILLWFLPCGAVGWSVIVVFPFDTHLLFNETKSVVSKIRKFSLFLKLSFSSVFNCHLFSRMTVP